MEYTAALNPQMMRSFGSVSSFITGQKRDELGVNHALALWTNYNVSLTANEDGVTLRNARWMQRLSYPIHPDRFEAIIDALERSN